MNNLIEFVATIFAIIGLVGGYFNARNRILLSYKVWLITNLFFIWYNFEINSTSQVLSNACYFLLAVIGYFNHKEHEHDLHN